MRKDTAILKWFQKIAEKRGYSFKIVGDHGYRNKRGYIRYIGFKNDELTIYDSAVGARETFVAPDFLTE